MFGLRSKARTSLEASTDQKQFHFLSFSWSLVQRLLSFYVSGRMKDAQTFIKVSQTSFMTIQKHDKLSLTTDSIFSSAAPMCV